MAARQKKSEKKKTARRVTTRKKSQTKKVLSTPRASVSRRKGTNGRIQKQELGANERHRRIQLAAYLKAEREGFYADPAHYWLAAEAELEGRA